MELTSTLDLVLGSDSKTKHKSNILLELEALQALYVHTNGATRWKRRDGWDQLPQMTLLYDKVMVKRDGQVNLALFGVEWCNNHVISVDLSHNGLEGRLPEELCDLTRLQKLKLRGNWYLKGPVPSKIFGMKELRYCYLDGTQVTKAFHYKSAHSVQTTRYHDDSVTMSFRTCVRPPHEIQWVVNISKQELDSLDATLKTLHPQPPPVQKQATANFWNATGPERTEAAIKLQRIFRARLERRKFRRFLRSLFEKKVDKESGYEYFIDTRTGEVSWQRPSYTESARDKHHQQQQQEQDAKASQDQETDQEDPVAKQKRLEQAWQTLDDGYGNTYYYNSITQQTTWEPPAFLSSIYQELRRRYGDDKTDEQRFDLLFEEIDQDHSDQIDPNEFARLCGELGMAMSAAQIQKVFDELDTSGDGQLSKEELIAWLTRHY